MKVWLVSTGEPLPIDAGKERPLRMGLFAQRLADMGHDVVWWASTFDHNHKRQRFETDTTIEVDSHLTLRLLKTRPYTANISLGRLLNHHQLGIAFERAADAVPASAMPDVIFAGMPVIELAAAAARYGSRNGIPVIIDVRDLHPDIYLSLVPRPVRPLARFALGYLYRELRTALSLATGLVAIAPSFLEWALRYAGRAATSRDAVIPFAYPDLQASIEEILAAGQELRAIGVDPDRKIVWYVGTYNRWIDLKAPIQAARLLASDNTSDVQFVFSGSGDFEPEWRRQAASLPNVTFTGWIGVPHIIFMRSVAWAGLAPYRSGFHTVGNKLFEYMAGGLPILLSIGGDARKIIEEHACGLSYEGGDPASLVKVIQTLLTKSVHDQMAAHSLRAYRDHYSAEIVYPEMVQHILSFANHERDGRS